MKKIYITLICSILISSGYLLAEEPSQSRRVIEHYKDGVTKKQEAYYDNSGIQERTVLYRKDGLTKKQESHYNSLGNQARTIVYKDNGLTRKKKIFYRASGDPDRIVIYHKDGNTKKREKFYTELGIHERTVLYHKDGNTKKREKFYTESGAHEKTVLHRKNKVKEKHFNAHPFFFGKYTYQVVVYQKDGVTKKRERWYNTLGNRKRGIAYKQDGLTIGQETNNPVFVDVLKITFYVLYAIGSVAVEVDKY